MKRVSLLMGSVLASAALSAAPTQRPNVLFITVDDLNDWISPLEGHPNMVTPNMQRLKERGVIFSNTYCQAPISGPSRTSFLTGLYPSVSGVYYQIGDDKLKSNSEPIAATEFLPKYFELNGYKTMAAGKIFHNGDKTGVFQEYGGNWGIYGPSPEKRFKYDPLWFGKPKGTQTDWGVYPEKEEDMPDHKTVEWCIAKLKEKHDKPIFLAAGLVRPHVPWYVQQKWFDLITMQMATYPPYNPDDYDDLPPIAKRITETPMMPDMDWLIETGYWKEIIHAYMACVAFADYNVGRLLDALDASPYGKNTIIVMCGDNGYELGQKGRFAKQALWRTSLNVPLIISVPNGVKNSRCDANVGLIDLYPTLVDLCSLPANKNNDGRSLAPLLKNPAAAWDYPAYSWFGPKNQSVFYEQYQYIRYSNGAEELYDLKNDIEEWYNLAAKPEYKSVLEMMRTKLKPVGAPNVEGSKMEINHYFLNGDDK